MFAEFFNFIHENLIKKLYKCFVIERSLDSGASWGVASWSGAAGVNDIVNGIFSYNGTNWGKTYYFQSVGGTPGAFMVPWVGYWVYLKANDGLYRLIIPKP